MESKALGKISSVNFGHCGYQGVQLGIAFSLESDEGSFISDKCFWDANIIEHSERHKWTEEERSKAYDEIMRYLSELLNDAKVKHVTDLKNIPVEITIEDGSIKSWRVLKEVL